MALTSSDFGTARSPSQGLRFVIGLIAENDASVTQRSAGRSPSETERMNRRPSRDIRTPLNSRESLTSIVTSPDVVSIRATPRSHLSRALQLA
jgi:hypothetical protein